MSAIWWQIQANLGGIKMDVNSIMELVGQCAFPVVMCVLMFKTMNENLKSNNENITKLCEKIDRLVDEVEKK